MQDNGFFFPQMLYVKHLTTINGIHFTQREIDVMACLLHVRGTSKIASLLNIAPSTVITHMQKVKEKIKGHSREDIIDFIEISPALVLLKRYYTSLLVHAAFEKSLKACSKMVNSPLSCLLVYCKDQQFRDVLGGHLQAHLKIAGIEADVQFQYSPYDRQALENQKCPLIVVLKKEEPGISRKLKEGAFLDLTGQDNYYLAVFDILKTLCPKVNFERIIFNLNETCEIMKSSSKALSTKLLINEQTVDQAEIEFDHPHNGKTRYRESDTQLFTKVISRLKKENTSLWILLVLGLIEIGVLSLQKIQQSKPSQLQVVFHQPFIRSDLIIPEESVLLCRPDLMARMEALFKHPDGTPMAFLIGPAGAGKTILARQYAQKQNASVVWEMNAERKESLMISFEELAYALSQTQQEKNDLKTIQEAKNPIEKETRLLLFLKEKLRSHSGWFLIYDNLEPFPGMLKYIPRHSKEWGNGKVLVTTRNATLQNTSYVKQENVIPVGELKKEEAVELFTKILYGPQLLSPHQREGLLAFLQNIPSFPLDISIAAYYIKNSEITPEAYLERISQPCLQFETIQETIAKDISDYAKTRHRITTLSLEHLIKVNKDFVDLCLFISLLDSQNIPKEMLDKYENAVVVDSFIYNLKKYSLITSGSRSSSILSLSLHRSIQEIMLNYLLEVLGSEIIKEKIQHIAYIMENYTDKIIGNEDHINLIYLIRHYESFLSHTSLLNDPILSLVRAELGKVYYCLGNYKKAEQLLEGATETLNKNYDYGRLIKFLIYLGKAYVELDDTRKMRRLCDQLFVLYKKFLGGDDIQSALVLVSLGDMYDSLGDYDRAQNLLGQGLAIYRKYYPKGSFEEAHALILLGNIRMKMEDFNKAKDLLEESFALHKKFFPKDHFRMGGISVYLGNAYVGLGNYHKAKELIETGVEIYKKYYPENHTDVAWASVYLANAYIKLQDYKHAQVLLEKNLIIYKKNFSGNHDGLIRAMTYLADLHMELGNYEKARTLLEEALIAERQRYGEEHAKVAQTLQNLGKAYFREGQIETAESVTYRVLKIFQKNKHPEEYACLENLADFSIKRSSIAFNGGDEQQCQALKKQARDYLKKALETIKAHGQEHSPHFIQIQSKLDNLEQDLGL